MQLKLFRKKGKPHDKNRDRKTFPVSNFRR